MFDNKGLINSPTTVGELETISAAIAAEMPEQFQRVLPNIEELRFHLPAFLIADLQGLFDFDLVYTFIHLDEYKEQQFSLLNAQQKQAVAQYLRWICTDPNCHTTADDTTAIEEALLLFWET